MSSLVIVTGNSFGYILREMKSSTHVHKLAQDKTVEVTIILLMMVDNPAWKEFLLISFVHLDAFLSSKHTVCLSCGNLFFLGLITIITSQNYAHWQQVYIAFDFGSSYETHCNTLLRL